MSYPVPQELGPAREQLSKAASEARSNNLWSGGTAVTDLYAAAVEARALAGTLADYIDTLRAGHQPDQPDADPVNAQIDHHLAQAATTLRAAAHHLTEAGEALGNGHTYPETALTWLRQRANTRPFEPLTTSYVPAPTVTRPAPTAWVSPTAHHLTAARQNLDDAGRRAYTSTTITELLTRSDEARGLTYALATYLDTLRAGFQPDHPDADPLSTDTDHHLAEAASRLREAHDELATAAQVLSGGPDSEVWRPRVLEEGLQWLRERAGAGLFDKVEIRYVPAPDHAPPAPVPAPPTPDQAHHSR